MTPCPLIRRSVPVMKSAACRARATRVVQVVAAHGHVADLAPGAHALAVHVHLDTRIARHHVQVGAVEVRVVPAEHVDHHGPGLASLRVAERQVEHGPQVLLELAGHRPVDASSARCCAGASPVRSTSTAGLPAASRVSNISTASTPTTPSSPAIRSAISVADAASCGSRPGAGAITSRQTPSTCTVSTTGQAAACPDGLRATRAASSREKATRSSASSQPQPWRQPVGAPRPPRTPPAHPCRRSRRAWSSAPPASPARPAPRERGELRGVTHQRPSRAPGRRDRPAGPAWPPCPGRAPARRAPGGRGHRCPRGRAAASVGTCSWSKVSTSHPRANAVTASASRWLPIMVAGITWAALSSARSASTASRTPSSTAAGWVIRASCPPPTMPTRGNPPVTPDRVASG